MQKGMRIKVGVRRGHGDSEGEQKGMRIKKGEGRGKHDRGKRVQRGHGIKEGERKGIRREKGERRGHGKEKECKGKAQEGEKRARRNVLPVPSGGFTEADRWIWL